MMHQYPMSDLLKAKRYLEKAKKLLCLGMAEGRCEECVCAYLDECFINSLEEVKIEIKCRREADKQLKNKEKK